MELFVNNLSKEETFRLLAEPIDTNATLKAKIQKKEGCFASILIKLNSMSLKMFMVFYL